MYTCTAYNSYGTMGRSEPTQVILQVRLVSWTLMSQHQLQRKPFPVSKHSYTWAPSEKTPYFLQDPPVFRVLPRPEYLQEVGRELVIPCEASGDPTPNITWSKVGEILHSDR